MFCLLGGLAGLFRNPLSKPPLTIVVAGNTLGYLSPCGCTEPMTGGILREAAALKSLRKGGPVLVLFTGDMVASDSRQDVMKADTLAQALGAWGVGACNLGIDDAHLGMGELLTLSRFTSDKLMTTSLRPSPGNSLARGEARDGYYIFGASTASQRMANELGETPKTLRDAVQEGLKEARKEGLPPILLLDGDHSAAVSIAETHRELTMIAYNSTGNPRLNEPEKVGRTYLVTPGEHGQFLVTLQIGSTVTYKAQPLTPAFSNDPETARFYKGYLDRIDREDLWGKTPRLSGPEFAGSAPCASCHQEAYKVWEHTGHAHALQTLNRQDHGRDPECLPCHVVGGEYRTGFQSLASTPDLAAVGCENCHGAGAEHVLQPTRFRLKQVAPGACMSCHEPLNSPKFDFSTYWPLIRHGG